MRRMILVLALLLTPAAVQAQEGDAERRAALQARRDSLEVEIVQKFVRRLSEEVGLNATQRTGVERVLQESGVQRRDLARASSRLRSGIYRATRNSETSDTEFVRLLAEHENLRAREHDLWRHEQEELARILTPRQRARFLLAWAHFQDDMRDILSRRMRELNGTRDRDGDRSEDERGGRHEKQHSAPAPLDTSASLHN